MEMPMFMLHLVASLAFALVLMSFFEYSGHRWLLHKLRMARRFRSKFLQQLCVNHMTLHHKKPYRHIRHEQDDNPWHLLFSGALVGVLVSIPIYFLVDPLTVKILFVIGPLHAVILYTFHREMHMRKTKLPEIAVLRWLDRKHQLHHVFPNRHFNVILPVFDLVFGTIATSPEHQPGRALHNVRQGPVALTE
jgi:hypothetical protein